MFIFSNLATSLDGKIATASRVHFPLGTPADRKQMLVLRRECDAVLMGASTLRAYQKPLLSGSGDGITHPLNVILSSNLEGISPDWSFFKSKKIKRLLFVGEETPAARIKKFKDVADVVQLKPNSAKNPRAVQIVRALEERGIKRLLVEGGGAVMWDFASQNLIDEYHVTLTPLVLGGTEAPTLVDGKGFEPDEVLNLKLVQCRMLGDELYLTYRKTDRIKSR